MHWNTKHHRLINCHQKLQMIASHCVILGKIEFQVQCQPRTLLKWQTCKKTKPKPQNKLYYPVRKQWLIVSENFLLVKTEHHLQSSCSKPTPIPRTPPYPTTLFKFKGTFFFFFFKFTSFVKQTNKQKKSSYLLLVLWSYFWCMFQTGAGYFL